VKIASARIIEHRKEEETEIKQINLFINQPAKTVTDQRKYLSHQLKADASKQILSIEGHRRIRMAV
jgi:hypothetical protein